MKNLLLAIIAILSCPNLNAQYKLNKELPANLMDSRIILSLSLDEELYKEYSKIIVNDLKGLGLNIVGSYNFSKNPTKAKEQMKEFMKSIEEKKADNLITVAFITHRSDFKSGLVIQKEKVYIVIAKAEEPQAKGEAYLIKKNTYNKVIELFDKQIKKQFSR